MWWILICAAVGFLWVGVGELRHTDELDALVAALGAAVVGAVLGFFVALIVGAFAYTDTHIVHEPQVRLINIADGQQIRGQFFLGTGTLNDTSIFTWYEQNDSNSFVQKHADADISAVHYLPEGSDEQPHYVRSYETYDKKNFIQPWGFASSQGQLDYSDSYDFYVPRGTITSEFKLDAQ